MKNKLLVPKIGEEIYVWGSYSISNGSNDVAGGKAHITEIREETSGGKNYYRVCVREVPSRSYNYGMLMEQQDSLKKMYGDQEAHPDPDIDTPWISEGDLVNGEEYHGPDIW